jgi:hypothetical protein
VQLLSASYLSAVVTAVADVLDRRGMTMEQLGRLLGYSGNRTRTLRRKLAGDLPLRLEDVLLLAVALDAPEVVPDADAVTDLLPATVPPQVLAYLPSVALDDQQRAQLLAELNPFGMLDEQAEPE